MEYTKKMLLLVFAISFITTPASAFVYKGYAKYVKHLERQAKKYRLLNIKKPYAREVAELLCLANQIVKQEKNEMRMRQDLQRITWEIEKFVNNEKALKGVSRYNVMQRVVNNLTGFSYRNKSEFYKMYECCGYDQLVRELDRVNFQLDRSCGSQVNMARLFDQKDVLEKLMKQSFLSELRYGGQRYLS